MIKRQRTRRPSPALLIACLALFAALGTGAYAAINLPKDSVKSKHIKNGNVKPKDLKSKYQEFCEPGAIKGSVVLSTAGLTTSYTNVSGFNCSGGAVQARKTNAVGDYRVRFVDNAGAATGVATFNSTYNGTLRVNRIADDTIGNEQVFQVVTSEPPGTPAANTTFTLLAY